MKRLLYIEDSPVTQKLMRRRLEAEAAITVASNLREARGLLAAEPFDLVLADVYLPDGSSLELVRELRTRFSPVECPIILISSAMDQLLQIQCLQAGTNDCFPSPTPWDVLIGAVRRMLESPYVRPTDTQTVAVTFVEGTAGNGFWIYCPELELKLSGENAAALRDQMVKQLRKAIKEGKALPALRSVKVSERVINVTEPSG